MNKGNAVKGCHNKAIKISQSAFSPFVHSTDYYATVNGMEMRWESVKTFTKFDIAL